jgi:molybdopterin-guanine dinucleotide biosynthesis protein A
MTRRGPLAGIVLAGGRSSRMGGGDKALEMLAAKPLLRHVIDRVEGQVDALALSVEAPAERFEAFGLPQLPDPSPGHHGPLGGLLSALRHFSARYPWLLLVPCDAPFLPADLAGRLLACACESGLPGAVAVWHGEWQPTFSIWHRDLLPQLERSVAGEGLGGFKQLARAVSVAECAWQPAVRPDIPPPFFNVNDHAALQEAERLLEIAAGAHLRCSA